MRGLLKRRCVFCIVYVFTLILLLYYSGCYQYLLALPFYRYVHWGPDVTLDKVISSIEKGDNPYVMPVNEFVHSFLYLHEEKCLAKEPIRVVYVVKSAVNNFEKRNAIRNTWGFENRFSDVSIRTVFLLGTVFSFHDIERLQKEILKHKDIIQADFVDTYFNNTLKTCMGLHWTFHFCKSAKYFLFVDDDYYVSTRNLLRFLRDPLHYPTYLEKYIVSSVNEYFDYLFAGFVFVNASPIRWIFSKWYVSLEEYPFSIWPPYITGGALVLSRNSLERLYYASMYTYRFRFDDVFLGMAARKAGLKPFHHKEFYFYKKPYIQNEYKWVIASHGFGTPTELQEIWEKQRSAGNA